MVCKGCGKICTYTGCKCVCGFSDDGLCPTCQQKKIKEGQQKPKANAGVSKPSQAKSQ